MTTATVEVTRPEVLGEETEGRVYLKQIAGELGLQGQGNWSWDRLLDAAAALYWSRRPDFTELCGTNPGYRMHELRQQPTCQPCRTAHATVKAIIRRRIELGVHPYPPRPALQPCGSHAAFVRHLAHHEDPCEACRVAENAYQAARPDRHRRAA